LSGPMPAAGRARAAAPARGRGSGASGSWAGTCGICLGSTNRNTSRTAPSGCDGRRSGAGRRGGSSSSSRHDDTTTVNAISCVASVTPPTEPSGDTGDDRVSAPEPWGRHVILSPKIVAMTLMPTTELADCGFPVMYRFHRGQLDRRRDTPPGRSTARRGDDQPGRPWTGCWIRTPRSAGR